MELMKAIVETQEKERNRIALDMHDELGPLLSAVRLQVGSIATADSTKMHDVLNSTENLLDEAIGQIRQIIRDLVPRNIDQKGLPGVLKDMKLYFETFTPLKIDLMIDGWNDELALQSEINIYRIIQEMVNNTVKHAGANQLSIIIRNDLEKMNLEVRDNGKGFDTEQLFQGSGLKNLETRIKMSKGEYAVKSTPGKGTSYYISFYKKNLL